MNDRPDIRLVGLDAWLTRVPDMPDARRRFCFWCGAPIEPSEYQLATCGEDECETARGEAEKK